ncbi:beta-lactamase-like protein [Xylanimonas cellulosilytica DSM 15894]|uniref:Beta-lactamase-like protein n=1 Tax=Xylanimonas cellulosilytica (strain DSM 15894 / JCM 12276 / CECT 5975 / KCTC 9989 / LMG 20990 / NBRC 107835 / XIL07) TaxID=446471 RepID=D1BRM9_XYLCX|nr:hydrolase [Xylanimonas cellulosilytica]ACZ32295.1 beta-lactamase-like protein [Xylanimonas cellulosilytica DSM 15894]
MSLTLCATCGVEHASRPEVCRICADERQWVPADGQRWTTLDELAAAGASVAFAELEPSLWALEVAGVAVGIGQQSKLLVTPAGALLWDPLPYVDDDAVGRVRSLAGDAGVVAVAASHPHMFGVQLEWSRRLGSAGGDVPVLVSRADLDWVARPGPALRAWEGDRVILPGVTMTQPGGHFPGSAVVHWAGGAGGRGVLLSGDTIFANPDRVSVSFMRSYPNRIPLSGRVAERVARHVARFAFERLYNNFDGVIPRDAVDVVVRSARRHREWTDGTHDHLT